LRQFKIKFQSEIRLKRARIIAPPPPSNDTRLEFAHIGSSREISAQNETRYTFDHSRSNLQFSHIPLILSLAPLLTDMNASESHINFSAKLEMHRMCMRKFTVSVAKKKLIY
jgi:hypothetical protein